MLSKEDLQNLTKISGFNLWQTEKDYLQNIFLLFLSKEMKREFVFKGGTALQKIYGLNRFSIDLDFTSTNNREEEIVGNVSKDISDFGFETKINKVEKFKDLGKTLIVKTKGPLSDGTEKTLITLRVDISLRKDLILEPEIKEVIPIYPDIKPYLVLVMNLEEVLAEKIRAVLWRTKARDVYDLWFLIRKNVVVDLSLINKKLSYYGMSFNVKEFKKKLGETKKTWETDLRQTVTFVPDFEKTIDEILSKFSDSKKFN